MPTTLLPDRLLRRELGRHDLYTQPKGIYGDRKWVRDLDIVNELDGHNGCVNALSWSKSGQLLASGSDDTHLNIHTYQPDRTENPFALTTTVSTGHSANIFSVKFMPHSNDRTLVTCAGDSEIRVFDVEHASSSGSSSTREPEGFLSNGIRYLSEADTNTRVYRSHSDRAKRIVTESSPFLFLSCSEDGEVRQWDIRQPSSAYPRPSQMSRYSNTRETANVPPPLISYKRYDLDLNTISCSASQPHYIALGGAHLHCFLHDRRMLGRDILEEQGRAGNVDQEVVSTATKCVKKFAPRGQQRMKRSETGHITACKISDANPNEMIASWSGDWIYNFDLLRSRDAREVSEEAIAARREKRARIKEDRNRKRKREAAGSAASREGQARGDSKAKTSEEGDDAEEFALRVRYENGQSEDVPFAKSTSRAGNRSPIPSPQNQRCFTIAKTLVGIRKSIFSLDDDSENGSNENIDPTGHAASFTRALRQTLPILEDMEGIMRKWRYPVDPENVDIALQNTLRDHRDRSRRFVQACGTVSRVLGGQAQTAASDPLPTPLDKTYVVNSSPLERELHDPSEQFCYDFLKAICVWLESGPGALAANFAGRRNRRPLPQDASIDDIDEILIPYLLTLASDRPIPNVDASPFEIDEHRVAFATEKAAVIAFASAIKIPFADLSQAVVPTQTPSERRTAYEANPLQDRGVAMRYWGFKIGRGVLMNAGQNINFAFVDRAFGGLGKTPERVRQQEDTLARRTADILSESDDDTPFAALGVSKGKQRRRRPESETGEESREDRTRRIHQRLTGTPGQSGHRDQSRQPQSMVEESGDSDDDMIPVEDVRAAARDIEEGNVRAGPVVEEAIEPHETADGDTGEVAAESDDDEYMSSPSSESEQDEDEDTDDPMTRNFLLRSAFVRSSKRHQCNRDVPAAGPQLHYEGAANARTVKDVNFYGLNDEYVVSGSDTGHFFIWDRASGQLLNILEGDGEVVNVVQGHPYEPMLAVSGIDHTIKVFSADKQARDNARKGISLNNTGESGFSTLRGGGRTRFGRARRPPRPTAGNRTTNGAAEGEPLLSTSEPAMPERNDESDTETEEAAVAPNGLSSRRRMHLRAQITSENDEQRRGQGRDTFITRGMLAQLAARLRMRQRGVGGEGEGEEDEDGEGGVIEIDGDQLVVQGGGDCAVQ